MGDQPAPEGVPPQAPPPTPPADPANAPDPVAVAEMQRLRERVAAFEKAEAERAAKSKAAEEAAALEKGEHTKVIESLRAEKAQIEARAAKWDAYVEGVAKENEAAIKSLPAAKRKEIEALGALDPVTLQRVISLAAGAVEPPPKGTRTSGGPIPIPQSAKDFAKRIGESPEWVFENVPGPWSASKETT